MVRANRLGLWPGCERRDPRESAGGGRIDGRDEREGAGDVQLYVQEGIVVRPRVAAADDELIAARDQS